MQIAQRIYSLARAQNDCAITIGAYNALAVTLYYLGDFESAQQYAKEASFCEAIRIAKEQKSISLEKRVEGTYAEYRRQKASVSGGRGFRLPLC